MSNAPIYLDVTHAATTIGALIAILPQGYVHMNVVNVFNGGLRGRTINCNY